MPRYSLYALALIFSFCTLTAGKKTKVQKITDSSTHSEKVAYSDNSWTTVMLEAEYDRLLLRQEKYTIALEALQQPEDTTQQTQKAGEEVIHRRMESSVIIARAGSLSRQQKLGLQRRARDISAQLKSMDITLTQKQAIQENKEALQSKLNKCNAKLALVRQELNKPARNSITDRATKPWWKCFCCGA